MKIGFNGTSYLVLKPATHNPGTSPVKRHEWAAIVGRCHNYATAEWMMKGIDAGTVSPQWEKLIKVDAGFFRA